jgi:hypothetical protein
MKAKLPFWRTKKNIRRQSATFVIGFNKSAPDRNDGQSAIGTERNAEVANHLDHHLYLVSWKQGANPTTSEFTTTTTAL